MQRKLKLTVMAFCCSTFALAQVNNKNNEMQQTTDEMTDESAFTFTEGQLGEDEAIGGDVSVIRSNSNFYSSQVGYLFSPARFKYRAYTPKYNDIYINGVPMNDAETGQFRFSLVGGLNQQTKSVETNLPFEANAFSMPGLGGSNNYNFRPSSMPTGHRVTLSGANRNYTLRGMYTYNSGVNDKGWAYSASVTYRWANRGYVKGTFYNSLSYFFGAEKIINDKHSLSLVTWGNPTERAAQGAATDEAYWLANSNFYNPNWGYQNGKVRSAKVINDFAPTAMLTWDWKMDDNTKLTTSFSGRYSIYKNTRLNYNNSDNPRPDYYKKLPSGFYDVWNDYTGSNFQTKQGLADWNTAYNYWTANEANRQIDWDRLYYANREVNAAGVDAMYYIQAKNNNQLSFNLTSSLEKMLSKATKLNAGINLASNTGMHFQTMEDLLGANKLTNINTYALGTYSLSDPRLQYDTRNPNAVIKEGDKFGYNYNILVNKANAWATLTAETGVMHAFVSGRIGGTTFQRDGKMENGLAVGNSYGKSKTAKFLDGGGKAGINLDLGYGNVVIIGGGYELRAPLASTAFASPEINNDFVSDLKLEKVLSAELGYQLQTSWLHANVNGYITKLKDVTEWQNFYFDDENSFSYVSMTGIDKIFYGVEAGLDFKLSSAFDIKAIGTISEAKNTNDAHFRFMKSTDGIYSNTLADYSPENGKDIVYNKDMREASTPLTALSLGVSYHQGGWFIDLNGNYYDRIYLSYSPNRRYYSVIERDNRNNVIRPEQSKGKGGFMLDASIGHLIRLKKGQLSINLMVANLLNNTKICTGGYEQSRSNYSSTGTERVYKFDMNPYKFYAYGINGMLNIAYKF